MECPQQPFKVPGPAPEFSVLLKRNCSSSPAGLALVFACLAVVTLAIGAGFAVMGAWLVLPFAGLEALVLAGAYLIHARHAADYERIELSGRRLRIEVASGMQCLRYEMDSRCSRLNIARGARLMLRDRGTELEVGRHLDDTARARLADELKTRLGN